MSMLLLPMMFEPPFLSFVAIFLELSFRIKQKIQKNSRRGCQTFFIAEGHFPLGSREAAPGHGSDKRLNMRKPDAHSEGKLGF
jgi:hypothetical protein